MPATRYAFLGPAGTFAHAAARQLAGAGAELVPHASVTQAIDALQDGAVDGALVPLENSVEGAVPATLDALTTERPLVIRAETFLPVVFDLVARPGTAAVRSIATHPHAAAQVRRYLLGAFPEVEVTPVGSTAAGARAVADGRYDAAVAPAGSAELYRLTVLAHDIADRQRPDHRGRLPAGEPRRRAAATAHRVRHPRREPDPDRVPADQGAAR